MSARRSMATVLALLLVSGTAGIVAAEGLSAVTPPDSGDAVPADDGPAYGVNNSTFQRLWSDDVDNGNLSVDDFDDANVSSRAEFAHRLARSTDVLFARPPQATSNWNSGDFGDYSPGGRRESVHPTGASLEDGVHQRCVRQHLRHTALDDTSPRERNDPVRCAGRSGPHDQ